MLATAQWPSLYDNYNAYIPTRASPLSPRSANPQRLPPHDDMPKHILPSSSPPRSQDRSIPFSKRPIKSNPLLRLSRDPEARATARETRRRLFLQQVREKREDQRYLERGEQLLRLDYKTDRRRWTDDKAKSALRYAGQPEDAEDVLMSSQGARADVPASQGSEMRVTDDDVPSHDDAEAEADRLRRQEEEEMDALLALMDEQSSRPASRYGSEDEYEGIFSELMEDDEGERSRVNGGSVGAAREGDVDMSG